MSHEGDATIIDTLSPIFLFLKHLNRCILPLLRYTTPRSQSDDIIVEVSEGVQFSIVGQNLHELVRETIEPYRLSVRQRTDRLLYFVPRRDIVQWPARGPRNVYVLRNNDTYASRFSNRLQASICHQAPLYGCFGAHPVSLLQLLLLLMYPPLTDALCAVVPRLAAAAAVVHPCHAADAVPTPAADAAAAFVPGLTTPVMARQKMRDAFYPVPPLPPAGTNTFHPP